MADQVAEQVDIREPGPADVPLPGMPPGRDWKTFTDAEIRRHAAESAEAALHEHADDPLLWMSLPGDKNQIREADVDRLRRAVLEIADEVRDRG